MIEAPKPKPGMVVVAPYDHDEKRTFDLRIEVVGRRLLAGTIDLKGFNAECEAAYVEYRGPIGDREVFKVGILDGRITCGVTQLGEGPFWKDYKGIPYP